MRAKSFSHTTSNGVKSEVAICSVPAGIRLTISGDATISGWFDSTQGAEIALAVLEASGVEPGLHEDADFGSQEQIEYLTYGLKKHVEAQERATAEAEAQAKLEAEALELRNAYFGDVGSEREWSDLTIGAQSTWITVARRAREINKEEK